MPAYIELFHGRTDPEEELEDWGSPGPIFGPLQFVHTTYACDIKFTYADESQRNGWLNVTEDFVYYDGVYYGDWSVFTELSDDLKERLVDFEQSKAESPQNCWYLIRLHGGIEPEVIGPFPTEIERDERARLADEKIGRAKDVRVCRQDSKGHRRRASDGPELFEPSAGGAQTIQAAK